MQVVSRLGNVFRWGALGTRQMHTCSFIIAVLNSVGAKVTEISTRPLAGTVPNKGEKYKVECVCVCVCVCVYTLVLNVHAFTQLPYNDIYCLTCSVLLLS